MKRGLSRHNNRSPSGSLPSLNLNFIASAILDPRVTFSRGTNATLTGSNGLIQYAPHNLLTNSEDFEAAAWAKGAGVTVAANATIAPDLTTTADNVAFATGGAADFLRTSPAMTVGVVYTVSVYALRVSGTPTFSFDIGNGGGGASTAQTPTTTWQRFSFTFTFAGANSWIDLEASGPGTIAFWGAQLNIGTTAQSYNPTTPKNLLGFTQEPENAAWTKSNSYVQTNLVAWSEDVSNLYWSKLFGGTSASATTFNFTSTFGSGFETSAVIVYPAGTTLTASFVAAGSGTISLAIVDGSGAFGRTFVDIALTATPTRYTVTRTLVDANAILRIYNGSGVAVTGATCTRMQLVQGSTAGDYTPTTSAAAPTRYLNWDGTLTGRKLVEDTAAATTHRVFPGVAVTVPTNGAAANIVYAKAGERTAVRLTDNDIQGADFDLLTGAVSNIGFGVTAAATNVGGGWWRLSVIRTNSTGTGRVVLYLISGGTITYTGDGTSGIYVSDFQLSNSASVDPYVYNPQAAAASAAYYGPRFDYDPVTLAAKGLLIEEQRTNLLTYSQDFSNVTAWPPTNITVTNAATTAPDGTNTAQSIAATTTAATLLVSATATVSATSATYSVYAKQGTGANSANTFILRNNTTATNLLAGTLNYSTGVFTYTIGSTGVSVQNAGNGWWRLIMTVTSGVTAGDGLRGYVGFSGASETAGTFLYAWGAQLEAGSFATSYIPTVASQVTRNADSASMLGDNFYTWYNPNQGTFTVQFDSLYSGSPSGNTPRQLALTPLAGASGYVSYWNNTVVSSFDGTNRSDATIGVSNWVGPHNIASAYGASTKVIYANGATLGSGAYAGTWASATGLTSVPAGHIRRIGYYNTRLPDSTLQAITS